MSFEKFDEEERQPGGKTGIAFIALLATILVAGVPVPSGQPHMPEAKFALDTERCAGLFARLAAAHELLIAMSTMKPESAQELDSQLLSYLDLNKSGRLTENDITVALEVLRRMQTTDHQSCSAYLSTGVDAKTYAAEVSQEVMPLLRMAAAEQSKAGAGNVNFRPPLSQISRTLKHSKG